MDDHAPMPDIVVVASASAIAFGLSLAALVIAKRSGLSDVDRTLEAHQQALVQALIARVDHLESENSRLTKENQRLREEIDRVHEELDRLERYIIKQQLQQPEDDA